MTSSGVHTLLLSKAPLPHKTVHPTDFGLDKPKRRLLLITTNLFETCGGTMCAMQSWVPPKSTTNAPVTLNVQTENPNLPASLQQSLRYGTQSAYGFVITPIIELEYLAVSVC